MDDDGNIIEVGIDRGIDQVDIRTVFILLGDSGVGQRVDHIFAHIVGTEYQELNSTIELVSGLLMFGSWQIGYIVAVQCGACGEDVGFTTHLDINIAVEGARHTLGIAFGHQTVAFDATTDKVVYHTLGSALRKGIVGKAEIWAAIGVGAYLHYDAGIVDHDEVQIHQRVHKLLLDVPFAEVVADFGQDDRLLGHRLHTEIVHDVFVNGIALGTLRAFEAEIVDFGEVHLIDYLAMHLAVVELVMTFLVSIGLSLGTVGADNLDLGTLNELHRLLIANSTLDSVEQRGKLEGEEVHRGQRNLLAFFVGTLIERVIKRTVGRKIATFHHGVVLIFGVVDDGHLVV